MKMLKQLVSKLGIVFENIAKARVNSVLLMTDRDQLKAWGYSWEALKQGPQAWPWRIEDTTARDTLPNATPLASPTRPDIAIDAVDLHRDAA